MPDLTFHPEKITFSAPAFLYLEKTGPFMTQAPLAWSEFHTLAASLFGGKSVIGGAGASRLQTVAGGNLLPVYQAGLLLREPPSTVPDGLIVRTLPDAVFARFLLKGSYSQLPAAYPEAFRTIAERGWQLRDDFCFERYLNDVMKTPEADLETEILLPVA